MNEHESLGMWSFYGGTSGHSLAIKSTIGNFIESLKDEQKRIFIGEVKYGDHKDAPPVFLNNQFEIACQKRMPFRDERELRAMVWLVDFTDPAKYTAKGEFIRVDLKTLIGSIVFSPQIPSAIIEGVSVLLKRHGLSIPWNRSELDEVPNLDVT